MTPGQSFAVRLEANYEHLVLLLNAAALQGKLAAIIGASADRPLRFHPLRDDTRAPGKALRDHFAFLANAVGASPVPLPDLVLTEFEQLCWSCLFMPIDTITAICWRMTRYSA